MAAYAVSGTTLLVCTFVLTAVEVIVEVLVAPATVAVMVAVLLAPGAVAVIVAVVVLTAVVVDVAVVVLPAVVVAPVIRKDQWNAGTCEGPS